MKKIIIQLAYLIPLIFLASCGGGSQEKAAETPAATETTQASTEAPVSDKGIGPVSSVNLGDVDAAMADKGKAEFESKCSSCHKIDAKHVGPALKDITKRRKPEWIMNMILNPQEMTEKDPVAKELLAEYIAPMANQSLTEEQARAILEYFRQTDK